jgi:uncharacterized protein YaeQ
MIPLAKFPSSVAVLAPANLTLAMHPGKQVGNRYAQQLLAWILHDKNLRIITRLY